MRNPMSSQVADPYPPYPPFRPGLARVHAGVQECGREGGRKGGKGGKVSKYNNDIYLYFPLTAHLPTLPTHTRLGSPAVVLPVSIDGPGTWFLPADPRMPRPKGTAAKHNSVVSGPVRIHP